jgi:hypothetical protein
VAAVIFGSIAVSCSGGEAAAPDNPLDQMVCRYEDLPEDYQAQTSGDFSVGDLADLAPDASARRKELRAAGLQTGHFSSWRQVVGDPPFDPPIEVVCQAMQFETQDQARQFVNTMRAEPGELATRAITWLPESDRRVADATDQLAGLPEGARAFRIEAEDEQVRVVLYAVAVANGRYVQSVYVGDRKEHTTLGDAARIASAMLRRLSKGAPGASPLAAR